MPTSMPKESSHFQEWMRALTAPKDMLLIDDSPQDCEIILHASKNFNIRWTVCHNAQDALEEVNTKKFHLIILDLELTGMSGLEFFRQIKKRQIETPVLVLSGYITNEIIVAVTRIGFAMFAQKPVAFDDNFFLQLFLALNIQTKRKDDGENYSEL